MKVISPKNNFTGLPIFKTLVILLSMDYWNAPEWLWGIVVVFLLSMWGYCIYLMFNQKLVDIFDMDIDVTANIEPSRLNGMSKSFKDRIKDKINESK